MYPYSLGVIAACPARLCDSETLLVMVLVFLYALDVSLDRAAKVAINHNLWVS